MTGNLGVASVIFPARLSSARGVSIHKAKAYKEDNVQKFTDHMTYEAVTTCKLVKQQSQRPVIHCGSKPLVNVFRGTYLGTTSRLTWAKSMASKLGLHKP